MRVKNRLLDFGDNIIYQGDNYFSFSIDSVLLANFVSVRYSDKKIMDFCCGNAPIPMLLSFRTDATIYGIELQKEIFEMGKLSIIENKMDDKINLICDDVMNSDSIFDSESFDVITCNPPYFKYSENSYVNKNDIKTIARHEVSLKLEDLVSKASNLLKNHGIFAMVHRPDRFIEIIEILKKYNIEPKRVRFCYSKKNGSSNILLIEGIKNGKSGGLNILSPLFIHNSDGSYCDEIKKMFGSDSNVAEKL